MSVKTTPIYHVTRGGYEVLTLGDIPLRAYMDETTTPQGVGPRYFLEDCQIWKYGPGGAGPTVLSHHDSQDAALEAWETLLWRLFWSSEMGLYSTLREEEARAIQEGIRDASPNE